MRVPEKTWNVLLFIETETEEYFLFENKKVNFQKPDLSKE